MLAVFAAVKNEATSIMEWLAFCRLVGFTKFILLDDGCTDGTFDLIRDSSFAAECEIVQPSSLYLPPGSSRQIHFYKYAIAQLQQLSCDWAIGLDTDEFLYSPTGESIEAILAEQSAHSGLIVSERVFGSSGLGERPVGQLVIETYGQHVDDALDLSQSELTLTNWVDPGYFKVFVQPKDVLNYGNAHLPITKKRYVHEGAVPFRAGPRMGWSATRSMLRLRINHYFAQSRADWNRKLGRGRISGAPAYDEALYAIYSDITLPTDWALRERYAVAVREVLNAG